MNGKFYYVAEEKCILQKANLFWMFVIGARDNQISHAHINTNLSQMNQLEKNVCKIALFAGGWIISVVHANQHCYIIKHNYNLQLATTL